MSHLLSSWSNATNCDSLSILSSVPSGKAGTSLCLEIKSVGVGSANVVKAEEYRDSNYQKADQVIEALESRRAYTPYPIHHLLLQVCALPQETYAD